MSKILALDLGTKTGFAFRNGTVRASSIELMRPKELKEQSKIRMDRRLDGRVPRLWDFLGVIYQNYGFQRIVFEDVEFSKGRMQAHLWASFRATAWVFAHQHNIQVECLATGKLKAWATGCGSADKNMMAAWLIKKHSEEFRYFDGAIRQVDNNQILDDNAVDAAHLFYWAENALQNESPKAAR